MRYAFLTNTEGGILDDLIVTCVGDYLFLVVNGSRKSADVEYLRQNLPAGIEVEVLAERGLIALRTKGGLSYIQIRARRREYAVYDCTTF